ncbi:KamA family radical SAM protein, partial [bacterium]|nr:KamA family radical SAM protein [bacterium]
EEDDMPTPGLTHRYLDRGLMVVTNACAMFCRHCTRKRIWNSADSSVNESNINRMINYIKSMPSIRDVIVSGGDPFTLPTARLESILKRLRAIGHVEIIRIGTRTPVTLPMRIDNELCEILDKYGPIWVNTQFNHPKEITTESAGAVNRLIRHGVCVNNQSVLLRGVNDDPETMKTLCRNLVKIKVRPYYLFQCDQVLGVEHFRTRVSKGIEIIENLRGHTTGFSIPTFVVDGPQGTGKIPLMPNYLISQSEKMSVFRNYEGVVVGYREAGERIVSSNSTSGGVASILAGQRQCLVPREIPRMQRRLKLAARARM